MSFEQLTRSSSTRPLPPPRSPWISLFARRDRARLRLICFPYAGGGASAYRPWALECGESIEVLCVQPPGRENRMREAPLSSIEALREGVLEALQPWMDRPFALFGHSMGALLALETAWALAARGGAVPVHLFVSGRRAPHLPEPFPPIHQLPDDAFLRELVQRYGAMPKAFLEDRELMTLLLPALRADFAAVERHTLRPAPPLPCALSVFAGADDPFTPVEQLPEWRRYAAGGFMQHVLPGEHFFINSHRTAMLGIIAQTLAVR